MLIASLLAILALRGLGVVWHNAKGPDPDYLHGFTAAGRCYPVDRVCPVLDQGPLEKAAGHGGTLTAGATTYAALDHHVIQGCELRNNDLTYTFQVVVYPDAASSDPPACAVEDTGDKVETVTDGRYTVCRWRELLDGGTMIVDDNAVVSCYATPTELSSLPALQPAVQRGCVRLVDALAPTRPRTGGIASGRSTDQTPPADGVALAGDLAMAAQGRARHRDHRWLRGDRRVPPAGCATPTRSASLGGVKSALCRTPARA